MVANTVPFPVPGRRPRPLPRPRPRLRRTASRAASSRRGTLGPWERWIGLGLAAGGAVMVPWMFVLARTLPSTTQVSNWPMAWIGLDALIGAGLLGTGVLLARRDPRHGLPAAHHHLEVDVIVGHPAPPLGRCKRYGVLAVPLASGADHA